MSQDDDQIPGASPGFPPRMIECGPCRLRPWRLSDKRSLIRYADNRNIWRNLRDLFPNPYGSRDADLWLAHAAADPPPPWVFAVDVDGEAVGALALLQQEDVERCSMEIGYWLAEPFWGRGIMTAAVAVATELALADPRVFRIFAHVFSWNTASMRVLEKAGYMREGVMVRGAVKDGTVIDRVLYAITRDPALPYVPAP